MAAFNLASKMAAKLSFQVFLEFTGWHWPIENKAAILNVFGGVTASPSRTG